MGTQDRTNINPAARIALAAVGVVQIAFSALAFWNLFLQDARKVRGPKLAWVPVILVNWIGPAVYFLFGIKHDRR